VQVTLGVKDLVTVGVTEPPTRFILPQLLALAGPGFTLLIKSLTVGIVATINIIYIIIWYFKLPAQALK
jgi:hypothetical protein